MRKIIISAISMVILCATVLSFGACSFLVQKQEVPAGTSWVIGDIVIETDKDSEISDYKKQIIRSAHVNMHQIGVWDDAKNIVPKTDFVTFTNDGKVTMTTYIGVGDASFVNGISVYNDSKETVTEIGTYSGKDIKLNDYDDAYISEDVLYISKPREDETDTYTVVLKLVQSK